MDRISIQTTKINGKPHVTVYLSDGITITERAGTSVIRTLIRTYFVHRRDRRALVKGFKTSSLSIGTPSFRMTRFKSRVDGIGRGVQS